MKNPYTENRRRPEKAASYDTKYERQLHKRISNWREKRLLGALLQETGRHERLLDVPSGAGRLSGLLALRAEKVYEVDHSREMLKLCRRNAAGYEPRLAEASVFQLPFKDGAFDLVVSIRLSHHIPARDGRLDHLRELFRASRRYVLVTFFGEESLKNRMRNLWRRLGSGKRAKYALSLREVEALAREHGFRIVRARRLSPVFSGHVFTLLERS
jgi:SAM-dependent methyltransferase